MQPSTSLTAVPAVQAAARRAAQALPVLTPETLLTLPPVIPAKVVAEILHITTEHFYSRKKQLENLGFPPKLPGVNGWSRATIMRWIETNGGSYQPAGGEQPEPRVNHLERRYG